MTNYKMPFIISLFVITLLIGVLLNAHTLNANGGKMPVFSKYTQTDGKHFSYTNKNDVELWYLTDIIKIRESIFSIGDLLSFLSFLGLLVLFTLHAENKGFQNNIKNNDKNNNRN